MYGEGKYNLNAIKETKVTNDYLGMDSKGCQNEEDFEFCKTNSFLKSLKENCNCLPMNLIKNNSEEVMLQIQELQCSMKRQIYTYVYFFVLDIWSLYN